MNEEPATSPAAVTAAPMLEPAASTSDRPIEAPVSKDPVVEQANDAKPAKKRRRGLLIAGISVGVLLVILGGIFLYLIQPPAQAAFHDPVDATTRSTNAALYAALVAAGISDPFVDTNGERAYVAYTLGNDSLSQADTFQRFVVGAAADASPGSDAIYAFQYIAKEPHQLWVVQMTDFLAYVSGDLSAAELEAKIQKTTF